MEKFKKSRTPVRSNFTKLTTEIDEVLRTENTDVDFLSGLLNKLEDKQNELSKLDEKILDLMSEDSACTQDSFNTEYESVDQYKTKFLELKNKLERYLAKLENKVQDQSLSSDTIMSRRKFKLPKLELKPFNGEVKNWLSFWGQFEKIHEDPDIVDDDKFQYLIQVTQKGTRAREIVESYPPTAASYEEVINSLKARFGRKDMLIEVYIRELLTLIMNNSLGQGQRLSLVKLFDKIESYLRSLKLLGVASENYASILYPLVESSLPSDILKLWERHLGSLTVNETVKDDITVNKLDNLMRFLQIEVEMEQKVKLAKSGFSLDKDLSVNKEIRSERKERSLPSYTASELYNASEGKSEESCIFCEEKHRTQNCKSVWKLTLANRKGILVKKGACFRCFNRNHLARTCKVKINCAHCAKNHHQFMCIEKDKIKFVNNSKEDPAANKDCMLTNKTSRKKVLLQTLVVKVYNGDLVHNVLVLHDTGSQRSYITKFAAKMLGYKSINKEKVMHSLFGGLEREEVHDRYLVNLGNPDESFRCKLEVLDQEKICSEITPIPEGSFISEIKKFGIKLSDRVTENNDLLYQNSRNEIHILIGADVAGKLFTGNLKYLKGGLVCLETRLGWTIMGKTDNYEKKNMNNLIFSLHVNEAKLTELWRLDTLGIRDPGEKKSRTDIELATTQHFHDNIRVDSEGRYEVSLPWIQGHPRLPNCKNIAYRRLETCVQSLKKVGKLDDYNQVFEEWLDEKIIERVDPLNEIGSDHFLPHRAVFKENSTTKVRPVFDGSARDKNSPSINDCIEKGPNLVELIPSILNRFRLKKIGVIADIKKAFLQIGITERDRPFLKFLWYEKGDPKKLITLQHRRVVFGISCSPYLLGATLEYHLKKAPKPLEKTASKLLESFYIDNCITSVDNNEQLSEFIEESKTLLNSAKFELRGWEHSYQDNLTEKNIPVLGLIWDSKKDTLSVDVKNIVEDERKLTKRNILSAVHKIFDPIGYTCPVTLAPKVLLQECWKDKITWDAELPIHIGKKFEKWKGKIGNLKNISIPRYILQDSDKLHSLHVFCDASKIAYATCIFVRAENMRGNSCQLVQARSRVSPMKSLSIPRLELLACNIGARLANSVITDLRIQDIPIFYWSDSANALYWIKRNENWAPFVFNRVSEIRSLSNPERWNFISGQCNPADLPSRGCTAEVLARDRWWEGPKWLKKPIEEWPKSDMFPDFDIIDAERRKSVVSAHNVDVHTEQIYDRFSSYDKLVRIIAWIYRFYNNCRKIRKNRELESLTSEETNRAENVLLKIVQKHSFTGPEDKRLKALQVMLDTMGIMRLKSRIILREDAMNFRLPIILPSEHPVVEKLVRSRHLKLGHAGVQIMMSDLREDFWILKFRKTVRKIIRNCVICKRYNFRPIEIATPPLPENRVREAAIFEIIGIDYAGPLILRENEKGWIVIYTCAVFRAIHFELTTSLSTESFLQTLRRFIARRGRPSIIYTDNGRNFVGAENLLKDIDWNLVTSSSVSSKIVWKFIPPSAPWWGGWWERLIGVTKRILRKVLGRSSLNFEEMQTVMCDIESVINNRPLTYISEDPNDLVPLTPSMFLQELKENGTPDLDFLDAKALNKRQIYQQKLRQDLRKRFRSEYLGQLRQPTRCLKPEKPFETGDVVIVSSDNCKKTDWPLAKITELFPSKDGHIRLAKIKMKNGEFLRPTSRLIPLEVSQNNTDLRDKFTDIHQQQCSDESKLEPRYPPNSSTMNSKTDLEVRRSRYGRVLKPRIN